MTASQDAITTLVGWAATSIKARSGNLSRATLAERAELESDWSRWLTTMFPDSFSTFAKHHGEFWDWLWDLRPGEKPNPFVAIWPRGGGKSTNAEAACVAVGARQVPDPESPTDENGEPIRMRNIRSYALYISTTQDQADDHVQNVAELLESPQIAHYYPEMAQRLVGKYGNSRGWRRNRLRTASGFTIDAVGMDTAARGMKLEDARPDFIIVDDIDEEDDSREKTYKKIRRLTHAILPAGSRDAAEVFIQNLILPEGIFARLAGLASEQADFLLTRQVSGPYPALRDLTYTEDDHGRIRITGGEPTWDAMPIPQCQKMIDSMGLDSFLSECQHLVRTPGTIVFLREWWQGKHRYDPEDHRLLDRSTIARWIHWDTAFSDKETADYSAACVLDLTNDYRIRVREVYRDRLLFPELLIAMEDLAGRWNHDDKLQEVTIEDKGSGTSAIQTLRATAKPWLRRMLVAWQPTGSKEQRARQASPWGKIGFIELPHPGPCVPWLLDFEAELYNFPLSLHLDQVDALVQGVLYLEPWLEAGYQSRLRGSA